MSGYWDQLVEAVIRPPRDVYREADLVGGTRANFSIGGTRYYREDLTVRGTCRGVLGGRRGVRALVWEEMGMGGNSACDATSWRSSNRVVVGHFPR